ncbi:TetR/AcrR family transcriptional regulator [Pseudoclavibacter chungangensis]|uniref:TetR/AcrR family transcriptional regulator n=1 Tax=Pseudoclavibacter chungangensis TaxID=587635 RepID=A0A7J5BWX1_9MICO|nr:TetR family transcriptional regulator [Pseudoclavibacter chungangensis]KAB1657990.1 TetR/AcrR family transcriptional regulator [Pseudoclavibacter chungangensis]NYJ65852.1 AcrR family transcriptional regulator [Pseudoclavibacter chungangensis]
MTDPAAPRRPSREAIFEHAGRLFRERGYAHTSVRDISSAAGVDAALVIRHFGSKEGLFLDTMVVDALGDALPGPRERFGERFVAQMLDEDARVRDVFLALVRASDADPVGRRLAEAHERRFVAPLREMLEGDDADLRARLAAALVGGLLYSMWVVGDEGLLAADRDVVVRRYGALLQSLLDA